MSKFFSKKFIFIFLLATVLWSGVGAMSAQAAETRTLEQACGALPSSTADPSYVTWDACRTQWNADSNAQAIKNAENVGWYDGIIKAVTDLPGNILQGIGATFLNIIGGLTYISVLFWAAMMRIVAAALNVAVMYTINSQQLYAVNVAIETVWSVVRNIFNMTFIFILLYSAIKMILGGGDSNTKKTVSQVVISAMLINFSLFFTKIIIDAGNILATSLYNLATQNGVLTIGSAFMDWTKLSGLLAIETKTVISLTSPAFFIITNLQLIMFMTATGIFFYLTVLFCVRSVMLIFLMAVSPIGFMGGVLPKIEEYTQMWWQNLIGQVSLVPVFLLFFYLISLVQKHLSIPEITALDKDDAQYMLYFKYLMIIILLITATKMAKKLSGEIGKYVEIAGKGALIAAAAAVTGGAAIAMGAKAAGGRWAATKKLITGDLGDEKGLVGMAARSARGNFMSGIKDMTNKKVDLKKMETDYKKYQKEEMERVEKSIDRGTSKALDEEKRLKDTLSAVDDQVKRYKPDLAGDVDKIKENKDALEKAEANLAAARDNVGKNAGRSTDEQIAAGDKLKAAEKQRDEIQARLDKVTVARKEVASSMGLNFDGLQKGINEAGKKITQELDVRNKSIKDMSEVASSTGLKRAGAVVMGFLPGQLSPDQMKKIVERVRASKGKIAPKIDKKKLAKQVAEVMGIEEDEKPEEGGEGKDKGK